MNQFENFLHGFLTGLVKEFHSFDEEKLIRRHLSKIETLDEDFFRKSLDDEGNQKFLRTRKPLSEINEIILKKLRDCVEDVEGLDDKNINDSGNKQNSVANNQLPLSHVSNHTKKLKNSLNAFIDGFTGKTNLFHPRYILLFRSTFLVKVLSLGLFFVSGIFIVISLKKPDMLGALSRASQQFLFSRWSGLVSLILFVFLPVILYRILNKIQADQRKHKWQRRAQALEGQVKNQGDLKLIKAMPSEGKQVVIVVEINNDYYVRSFDKSGKIILDKGPDEFLPNEELIQEFKAAFSRSERSDFLNKESKEELARKITSSLGLDSKKSLEEQVKDQHDLKLIKAMPSEGKQVVIVVEINNDYYVRSFDKSGKIILDKGPDEFLPNEELIQEFKAAFSRSERSDFLNKESKEELARKITSSLGLDSKKSLAGIFDDYFASDEFSPQTNDLFGETVSEKNSENHKSASQDEIELLQKQKTLFSREISQRLQQIYEEPADLYREMRDLGRSFRRYYLRFLLENADIDLAFIPSSVKQSLAVLIRRSETSAKQAEDQILHLKEEVEAWYDRSMERASGVYKRNAKGISILIGIILAIALNANSIHILDQLAFEQELRAAVLQSAERIAGEVVVTAGELSDDEQSKLYRETSELLDDMDLPIGWDPDLIDEEFNCGVTNKGDKASELSQSEKLSGQGNSDEASDTQLEESNDWDSLFHACLYEKETANGQVNNLPKNNQSTGHVEGLDNTTIQPPENFFPPTAIAAMFLAKPLVGLKFLIGWILKGIAISMGASFWFDLLSKLVNVRNTGKRLSTPSANSETQTVMGKPK